MIMPLMGQCGGGKRQWNGDNDVADNNNDNDNDVVDDNNDNDDNDNNSDNGDNVPDNLTVFRDDNDNVGLKKSQYVKRSLTVVVEV